MAPLLCPLPTAHCPRGSFDSRAAGRLSMSHSGNGKDRQDQRDLVMEIWPAGQARSRSEDGRHRRVEIRDRIAAQMP